MKIYHGSVTEIPFGNHSYEGLLFWLMAAEFSMSDQKARREQGYKKTITFDEGIRALKK